MFELPHPSRMETRDVEKLFARLFSTEDGRNALTYLGSITFMRAAGMEAADSTLRYIEGQRSLLATILRLIERGQKPQ